MTVTTYGSYRIISELGAGGMGVVYRAEHVTLGSPAVVKVLRPEYARNPTIVQRFINEAKAAASLKHRNIVVVHDCGQASDGQWFIALEFLDGMPLSTFIEQHGGRPVDLQRLVHILAPACNALQAAHDHVAGGKPAPIVHRDVKPDNLFLTRTGDNDLHVTVLDFGIAKLAEHEGGGGTKTGHVMGTLAYMAPEQLVSSKAVGPQADVYALGVIAYQMVTGGYLPWMAPEGQELTGASIYHLQMTQATPDPRRWNPALPEAWAYVVMRALANDPGARWGSAREFALAMAEATAGGLEIVDLYARELRRVPSSAATIGSLTPGPSAGHASGPQGTAPIVPGSYGTPSSMPWTAQGGVPRPGSLTTLGSAASAISAAAPASRKRVPWLYAAIGGIGVAGAAGLAVALGGGDKPMTPATELPPSAAAAPIAPKADPPAPAPSAPAATAVAILTEPSGASVFVDNVLKGTAPINLAVPAGSNLDVRAELAGHVTARQQVRVGATPDTVHLVLASVVVDAGVPSAAPPPRPKPDPHHGSHKGGGGTHIDPNDVGGD